MMSFEVPYINGLLEKFWYIVLSNRGNTPNFTDLLNLADSIVIVDNSENIKDIDELNYVRKHTHVRIDMPAASFEMWMIRNWRQSINKDLTLRDGFTLKLYEAAEIIDEVILKICRIVTNIGKKYSLSIQYEDNSSSNQQSPVNPFAMFKS